MTKDGSSGVDIGGRGAIEDEQLFGDPYVQLVLRHVRDPEILAGTPERARARQRELLRPFLDFFLRHDRDGYYRALYRRRGLLDEASGAVRSDVQLSDLTKLRIHSDDLRGNGQRARLIREVAPEHPGTMVYGSSGTTQNTTGPVTIVRSSLTMRLLGAVMGSQFEWSAGHSLRGGCTMIYASPPMLTYAAMARVPDEAFRHCGAEVVMGANLREDPSERNPWRRLEPNFPEMRRFFGSPARGKVMFSGAPSLFGLVNTPEIVRQLNPETSGEPPTIDLGEDGVIMTGGGLKRLPQFQSMRELAIAIYPRLRARRDGALVPARFADVFGLTECVTLFAAKAGDPADDKTWLKCPYPLTWVGMLESPQRLQLVPEDEFGQKRLLFYVNFTCLDYLEAIVSGDVVVRTETPSWPQHAFVYERRAEAAEGFQIREGCG